MNESSALAAADRADAARAYAIFPLFLLAWTAFVGLLWRAGALPTMALFWLKVPVWLLPRASKASLCLCVSCSNPALPPVES